MLDRIRKSAATAGRLFRDFQHLVYEQSRARLDILAGRYQEALLRYGRLIRNVQLARESLRTYRQIDALLLKHPEIPQHPPVSSEMPERFLLFVGYSRSGHSLVAALLDAHPHITISHELHALKHLKKKYPFQEIMRAIQYNAYFFSYFGRSYFGYDYQVKAQSQGRSTEVKILGDKKANGTIRLLRASPHLVGQLDNLLPMPFSLIHVIRNPFDNIATKARRSGVSLRLAAQRYFSNAEVISCLQKRWPDQVHDVYLEDLIADPPGTLRRLLEAIGVGVIHEGYLRDCAAIVFKEPRKTRQTVAWEPALVRSIQANLERYSFLQRFLHEPQTDMSSR